MLKRIYIFVLIQFISVLAIGQVVDTTTFIIGEREACVGDTLTIPVTVADFDNVFAFQFAVNFDPAKLDFLYLEQLPSVSDSILLINGNTYNVFPDQIRTAWNGTNSVSLMDGDTLLTLTFRVLSNSSLNAIALPFDMINLPPFVAVNYNDNSAFLDAKSEDGRITFTNRIQVTASPDRITCDNDTIVLSATARDANAGFMWSDKDSLITTNSAITIDKGGFYSVVATFGNCIDTTTIEVLLDTIPPQNIVAVGDDFDCQNAAQLMPNRVDNNFQYTWMAPNGGVLNGAIQAVTEAGIYTLTIENPINGCVATDTTLVGTAANLPDINISSSGSLNCNLDSIVVLAASSSLNTVSYRWEKENVVISMMANLVVDTEGTYRLYVIDETTACTSSRDTTIIADRTLPLAEIEVSNTRIDCLNPTVELTTKTIAPNVYYEWYDGQNNFLDSGEMIIISAADDYSLVAIDTLNNCRQTSSIISIEGSSSVPNLAISSEGTIDCNGNNTQLFPSSDASYEVVWQDSLGNILSDNEANQAGRYYVYITDIESGCIQADSLFIEADTNPPSAILSAIDTLTCSITSIEVEVNTEITNPIFTWRNTVEQEIATGNKVEITTAGTYSLELTDANNNCVTTRSFTVLQDTIAPIFEIALPALLDCRQEEVDLVITSNNSAIACEWLGLGNTCIVQVEEAGIYTASVTDTSNACSTTATTEVLSNRQSPNINLQVLDEFNCINETATIGDSSIHSSYSYEWSATNNSTIASPATATTEIYNADTYSLSVTDTENGCSETFSISVTNEVSLPAFTDIAIQQTDCDMDSGSILIGTILGGAAPYLLAIDDEGFSAIRLFDGLSPSEYTITIEDAFGCTADTTIAIQETASIEATILSSRGNELQAGDTTILSLEGTNLDSLTHIIWRTEDAILCEDCLSIAVSPLESTDYFVELTTQGGCTSSADFQLLVDSKIAIYFPNVFSPNNDGINDFFILAGSSQVAQINSMQIFSRWGEQVFKIEGANPLNNRDYAWDGRLNQRDMPNGTYIFFVEISLKDGTLIMHSGEFQLLR